MLVQNFFFDVIAKIQFGMEREFEIGEGTEQSESAKNQTVGEGGKIMENVSGSGLVREQHVCMR